MSTGDEKLNQLLNTATVVAPNTDLAERIIHAAKISSSLETSSEKDLVQESFMQQFLQSFILPKPAYALACSLLLGVLIGWQSSDSNTDSVVVAADTEFSSIFLAEVNFYE